MYHYIDKVNLTLKIVYNLYTFVNVSKNIISLAEVHLHIKTIHMLLKLAIAGYIL